MTATRVTLLGSAVAIVVASLAAAGHASKSAVRTQRDLALELVGQFVNSPAGVTPQTHTHYGYLASVRGITSVRATPPDEATALFTFYADATTVWPLLIKGVLEERAKGGHARPGRSGVGHGRLEEPRGPHAARHGGSASRAASGKPRKVKAKPRP